MSSGPEGPNRGQEQNPPAEGPDAPDGELEFAGERMDADALGELFAAQQGLIFQQLLAQVHDPDLADELTSRAFLKALQYNKRHGIRQETAGGLLNRCAHTVMVDYYRSVQQRGERSLEHLEEEGFDVPDEQVAFEEHVADTEELQAAAAEAMNMIYTQLRGHMQQVLAMRANGVMYKDIAAALGININTAKACVWRFRHLPRDKAAHKRRHESIDALTDNELFRSSDLSRLSELTQQILRGIIVGGATFRQVGEAIGMKPKTVSTRYARGIAMLRRQHHAELYQVPYVELLAAADLSQLSEDSAGILQLRIIGRQQFSQIARAYGISYHAAFDRFHTALEAIRRQYALAQDIDQQP